VATQTPLVESLTAAACSAIDALAMALLDEAEDAPRAEAMAKRAIDAKDAVRALWGEAVGLPGCVGDGDDDDTEDDDDDEYVPMPEPDEVPAPLPETQTAPA